METNKSPEQKPYLQDLFDHMRNEHGLILTQSEMQEIMYICSRQYESVGLSTEERAIQYVSACLGIPASDIVTIKNDRMYLTYIAGYNSGAYHQLVRLLASNTELREALRELVDKTNMLTYSIVEEERTVNDDFFADTMDALSKAKTLIND